MNTKQIIISDPSVKSALAVTLPAHAKYQTVMQQLEVPLYPEEFLDAANLLLAEAKSAKEIKTAQSRLFALQGDAAHAGRITARRLAFAALEEFKKTLPALIEAATTVLAREQVKARNSEAEFFKAHGLPYEETSVSRRFLSLAAEVRHLNHCLIDNSPAGRIQTPARRTYANVVEWFNAS